MPAQPRAITLAQAAAQAAADKQAHDISLLDVSEQLVITDAFVIVSASNERLVSAVVDEVESRLRDLGAKPVRREAGGDGQWVLIDYVEIVVHVFHADARQFYALERLWKDCPQIEFTDAGLPADPGVAGGAGR